MKKIAFGIVLAISMVIVCVAAYFSGLKSESKMAAAIQEPDDGEVAAVTQEIDGAGENFSTEDVVSHKDCFWAVAKDH